MTEKTPRLGKKLFLGVACIASHDPHIDRLMLPLHISLLPWKHSRWLLSTAPTPFGSLKQVKFCVFRE
jgi:hypothetical protein